MEIESSWKDNFHQADGTRFGETLSTMVGYLITRPLGEVTAVATLTIGANSLRQRGGRLDPKTNLEVRDIIRQLQQLL